VTRIDFIVAWREHRERILFERYTNADACLGPKLTAITAEANEFWKKHREYLVAVDVKEFFARVLSANKEVHRHG
jgi:hypothetical protein